MKYLVIAFLFIHSEALSQISLNEIQGSFKYSPTALWDLTDSSTIQYLIIKDNDWYNIVILRHDEEIFIDSAKVALVNQLQSEYTLEEIDRAILGIHALIFYSYAEDHLNGVELHDFKYRDNEIEFVNSRLHSYARSKIDLYSLRLLYDQNTEFIWDKYNPNVRSTCVDQLDIFDTIEGAKQGYLVQGDLVEILEESGDWVKVKFLKTNKIYWTYQSCLE